MCEGLARYGFDFATAFMVSTFTAMNIVKFGTKAQQEHYLPAYMRGDIRFSISISEPSSGSDAASTRTRAKRTNEGWSIKGPKALVFGRSRPQRDHRDAGALRRRGVKAPRADGPAGAERHARDRHPEAAHDGAARYRHH